MESVSGISKLDDYMNPGGVADTQEGYDAIQRGWKVGQPDDVQQGQV